MISLVPIHGIASSYNRQGQTRLLGKVIPYEQLRDASGFKVTAGTYADLQELNAAMKAAGSAGIRITEADRSMTFSASERAKYDAWVRANRPTPGKVGWISAAMRTSYVAAAGESNHNWGGAIDIDAYALDFPDITGGSAQLSRFWELAIPLGFTPIISEPNIEQAECWHFNHRGPLSVVYDRLKRSKDHAVRTRADPETAKVGCVLAGTYVGVRSNERLIQARLAIVGEPIDVDGVIGPATRAALAKHIGTVDNDSVPNILNRMDAARVGDDHMAST